MHHLTQVQRGLPGIERSSARRRARLDARTPREPAAHVLPGRLEDAVQELLVIQHGGIELLRPTGAHLGAVHRHHRAPGSRRTVLHAQPADSPSRVRVYGQAVKGLLTLERNPDLRQKYLDFIETYLTLTAEEWRLYEQLYPTENRKMGAFTQRWLEQGRQEGIRQGILQGRESGREEGIQLGAERTQRQTLALLLTQRFGPLDGATEARLASASMDELTLGIQRVLNARSPNEVFRLK